MAVNARQPDEPQRELWRRGAPGWKWRRESLPGEGRAVAQWPLDAIDPQPSKPGAGANDCAVTQKHVKLLDVDRSLTDDLARWLAPTDLRPALVPAPLVGLFHAVAAARPEELSPNDPVPATASERQAAVLILIATDRADAPDILLAQRAPQLRDHAGEVAFPGARVSPATQGRPQPRSARPPRRADWTRQPSSR